ncbi:MAG: exodeoxyribonuclease I [Methylococcaceae bacterium]|nr:exodeoxyribonuclease I [Methylococcaceae bacterium]
MPQSTLYWHDYETFGVDPRRDRPAQFAGIRTDEDLNIIGDPLVIYCQPANDMLPVPEACLVTGITPQMAQQQGIPEAKFSAAIHAELSRPGTCGVGYNTLRFDDEVTRNCLYRNFYDPYEREWRNGNSRWDIIDMVRLTAALRPEGIEWPLDPEGRPSFRLELLTAVNGIAHAGAHDALVDVLATIELARLIKKRQPKLYDFIWRHRGKREAAELLKFGAFEPVLHISEKYPAEKNCIAVVVALARHPQNQNEIVVYDLGVDPAALLELGAEAIRTRVFTRAADLPEGVDRIPLKTVHLNRCPVLVPIKTLRPGDARRLNIDESRWQAHLASIKAATGLAGKLEEVFGASSFEGLEVQDPDLMIYSGGFFSGADKLRMSRLRAMSPEQLALLKAEFDDRRLAEMLFRYRARNYLDTLNEEESRRWELFRRKRLTEKGAGGSIVIQEYEQRLSELEAGPQTRPEDRQILASLRSWGREIIR